MNQEPQCFSLRPPTDLLICDEEWYDKAYINSESVKEQCYIASRDVTYDTAKRAETGEQSYRYGLGEECNKECKSKDDRKINEKTLK